MSKILDHYERRGAQLIAEREAEIEMLEAPIFLFVGGFFHGRWYDMSKLRGVPERYRLQLPVHYDPKEPLAATLPEAKKVEVHDYIFIKHEVPMRGERFRFDYFLYEQYAMAGGGIPGVSFEEDLAPLFQPSHPMHPKNTPPIEPASN